MYIYSITLENNDIWKNNIFLKIQIISFAKCANKWKFHVSMVVAVLIIFG